LGKRGGKESRSWPEVRNRKGVTQRRSEESSCLRDYDYVRRKGWGGDGGRGAISPPAFRNRQDVLARSEKKEEVKKGESKKKEALAEVKQGKKQ